MTTGRINQVAALADARAAAAPPRGVPRRSGARRATFASRPTEKEGTAGGSRARPPASPASESTHGRRAPGGPRPHRVGRGARTHDARRNARRSQGARRWADGVGRSGRERVPLDCARGRKHRQRRHGPRGSTRAARGRSGTGKSSSGWPQDPAGSPRGLEHRAPLTRVAIVRGRTLGAPAGAHNPVRHRMRSAARIPDAHRPWTLARHETGRQNGRANHAVNGCSDRTRGGTSRSTSEGLGKTEGQANWPRIRGANRPRVRGHLIYMCIRGAERVGWADWPHPKGKPTEGPGHELHIRGANQRRVRGTSRTSEGQAEWPLPRGKPTEGQAEWPLPGGIPTEGPGTSRTLEGQTERGSGARAAHPRDRPDGRIRGANQQRVRGHTSEGQIEGRADWPLPGGNPTEGPGHEPHIRGAGRMAASEGQTNGGSGARAARPRGRPTGHFRGSST